MKRLLCTLIIATLTLNGFSQDHSEIDYPKYTDTQKYTYAYVAVSQRVFSRKFTVYVDLGDTPEQIKEGNEYSKHLNGKTSRIAVLNYMVKNQYELVQTIEYGAAERDDRARTVFIMRRRLDSPDRSTEMDGK